MSAAVLLAALLAPAPPAIAMPFPPAARWGSLPRLAYRPAFKPRTIWVARAQALEGRADCRLPRPDAQGVVRLAVPFGVLLGANGAVRDAHADAPDCPALAALVEAFARQLGPKSLLPPKGVPPFWYASHFLAGWAR